MVINAGLLAALVNDINSAQAEMGQISGRLSSGKKIQYFGDDVALGVISSRQEFEIGAIGAYQFNITDGLGDVNSAIAISTGIREVLVDLRIALLDAQNLNQTDRAVFIQQWHAESLTSIDALAQSATTEAAHLVNGNDVDFGDMDIIVGSNGTVNSNITVTATSLLAADLGLNALAGTTDADIATALAEVDAALDALTTAEVQFGGAKGRLEGAFALNSERSIALEESVTNLTATDIEKDSARFAALQVQQDLANLVLGQMLSLQQRTVDTLLGG